MYTILQSNDTRYWIFKSLYIYTWLKGEDISASLSIFYREVYLCKHINELQGSPRGSVKEEVGHVKDSLSLALSSSGDCFFQTTMTCRVPACAAVDILPFTPIPSYDGFSAKLEDEHTCLLTQIINIGNKLLVIDNENKRLKRFRIRSRSCVDHLLLNDPCGASLLPLSSHVIVTEPEIRTLSFVCLEETMTLSSRRKTEKKYLPVCCIDEERLVAGCCELGESSVDILNYMGIVLITVTSYQNEAVMFRTPASLTYLPGDQCILVSDSGICRVVGLTVTGKPKFIFNPKCTPSGICADKDKNVFLCCYDKKYIQCLKYENNQLHRTCSDFIMKCPLSVTTVKNYLYVTEEMPSDKVSILQVGYPSLCIARL